MSRLQELKSPNPTSLRSHSQSIILTICQPKREPFELKQAPGSAEGRLLAVLRADIDCVECPGAVDGAEGLAVGEAAQVVADEGQRGRVFPRDLVEGSVI